MGDKTAFLASPVQGEVAEHGEVGGVVNLSNVIYHTTVLHFSLLLITLLFGESKPPPYIICGRAMLAPT